MRQSARPALAAAAFFAACGLAGAAVWVPRPASAPAPRPEPLPARDIRPPAPDAATPAPKSAQAGAGEQDEASLDVQASPPRCLPDTYDGDPITRMPWPSPTGFVKMPQIIGFGPNTTVLAVTDVETGRETPLRAINAVIRQAWGVADDGTLATGPDGKPTGLSFNPYATRLSPDGRWLLWPSRAEGRPVWTAMTLDGTRRVDWPRHTRDDGGNGGADWMRDSLHVAEISRQTGHGWPQPHACVYSLDAPGQAREFPLAPPRPAFLLPPFPNSDVVFTGDGHGWVIGPAGVMGTAGDRYEIVPGPTAWALRPAPLLGALDPALAAGTPTDAALSPDGSRLVWQDHPDGREGRTRLFLSRPDGSEARVIFETPQRLPCGSSFSPRWTPDGGGIVIHWHGSNRISNLPNGEGLYLLTLSPADPPADAPAVARVPLGPFPTGPAPHRPPGFGTVSPVRATGRRRN